MKKILSTAAVLSLVATASAATGSHGGPAPTHFITYANTGLVYVYFDITGVTNIPACGQNRVGNTYNYVFDGTTPAGKSMLAGLVAAHSVGEGVWFYGTGDCGVLAGTETLASYSTEN